MFSTVLRIEDGVWWWFHEMLRIASSGGLVDWYCGGTSSSIDPSP